MNTNARAFVPQNMATRTNNPPSTPISRAQRPTGRNVASNQSSLQPESRRNGPKNQNYHTQGDPNARLSVINNKRNNNSRRNKNRHSHHQQRHPSDADADVKNGDKSSSHSSGENDSGQADESHSPVTTVTTALNDMAMNDKDPVAYGAPNRRGQISLNHLLNFSFPPRQSSNVNVPRRQRAINYQPYNKERFLNANFRFLVKSMGDYTVYQADPDLLLNWQDIEQVIITNPNIPGCPICLQQPTAARVTKCGHTYCLACILHYLQLNDDEDRPNKKWRKCPICWDAVYSKDLKSVRFWTVRTIGKVGGGLTKGEEMLTMRLIQRPANSTVALPRSSTWPLRDDNTNVPSAPWYFTPNALAFSKLTLVSIDYMQSEYDRDLSDLEDALQEARNWNSSEEIPFIEMAMVNVKEHLEVLGKLSTKAALDAEQCARGILDMADADYNEIQDKKNLLNTIETSYQEDEVFADNKVATSHGDINNSSFNLSSDAIPPPFLPEDFKYKPHIANLSPLDHNEKPKIKATKDSRAYDRMYYYYQSEDGQHIYLHPLDIRVLKQEFGSYNQFPNDITVRILGVDESTMTEDLRKRCKYLSHLPLGCDVTFLEVDLKGFVSDNSLKVFESELRQRYNRRKEKARKEEWPHELAVRKERQKEIQQESLRSDSFFQPYSYRESGSRSGTANQESSDTNENVHGSKNSKPDDQYNGPKTVWGTPAVSFPIVTKTKESAEDDDEQDLWDYPEEEIYVGKKQKKKKLVLMSTIGKRQR
ncbi:4499_t:CDS:10 [Funneliformis caledonium]|uniref:4499_t:CDS:1 n=1 Tax=Funneliformis caledonium TaxID=1117310 RepID=A0A9N8ZBW9_9GLOM|nr:4499_t:CDS:10 [Funneliformis caledonium]